MVAADLAVDDLDDRYQAPNGINLAVQGINRIDRRRADVVGLTNGNDILGHKNPRMMAPPGTATAHRYPKPRPPGLNVTHNTNLCFQPHFQRATAAARRGGSRLT